MNIRIKFLLLGLSTIAVGTVPTEESSSSAATTTPYDAESNLTVSETTGDVVRIVSIDLDSIMDRAALSESSSKLEKGRDPSALPNLHLDVQRSESSGQSVNRRSPSEKQLEDERFLRALSFLKSPSDFDETLGEDSWLYLDPTRPDEEQTGYLQNPNRVIGGMPHISDVDMESVNREFPTMSLRHRYLIAADRYLAERFRPKESDPDPEEEERRRNDDRQRSLPYDEEYIALCRAEHQHQTAILNQYYQEAYRKGMADGSLLADDDEEDEEDDDNDDDIDPESLTGGWSMRARSTNRLREQSNSPRFVKPDEESDSTDSEVL